jgi:hypothetical protein
MRDAGGTREISVKMQENSFFPILLLIGIGLLSFCGYISSSNYAEIATSIRFIKKKNALCHHPLMRSMYLKPIWICVVSNPR